VGIHVPVHFHDFAARGLVDKIVPDDVRPKVAIRVPDLAQEFIQSSVHAILFDCCVYLDVATGLLPVDPEQVITPTMILVLLARSVRNPYRALRRPVPLVLVLGSERGPHATGVTPAERKPVWAIDGYLEYG
jgi:hypothetical protein